MYNWIKKIPPIHWIYMKIAEPRVVRLLHFGAYLSMLTAGTVLLLGPPHQYKDVIGLTLVIVLGIFLVVGGLLGAVSVLPGVWWLERVGIILIATGMAMYVVIVLTLRGSVIGVAVPFAFVCLFTVRWITIRHFQLAPTLITAPREE